MSTPSLVTSLRGGLVECLIAEGVRRDVMLPL